MQDAECMNVQPVSDGRSLRDRVALFNTFATTHVNNQALNPFSQDKSVSQLERRRFSKEEYGRPQKGSKSEIRGFKANLDILKEILQLCEVLDQFPNHYSHQKKRKTIQERSLALESYLLFTPVPVN
ncbi:hypothetical protein FQR65_LT18258 [Abscondita terminalis]|nr:hypothetical protein FQR65_LT18258 [Abscondita terminalis]